MRYQVSAKDAEGLHLNETDPVQSVLQSIAIILSTPRGTVPLYRDFGLDWKALDKPLPVAQVLMVAEIREAIERWAHRDRYLLFGGPRAAGGADTNCGGGNH